MKKVYALANAFDADQTRSAAGAFSADASDASSAAHKASAQAYEDNTAEAHERAAKLNRAAAKRHSDNGNEDAATLHESIAKGHDSLASSTHPALANEFYFAEEEGGNYRIALDNGYGIDDDGWSLIAPFGEHPKTRLFRENGQIREQQFIQVLDNEAADAMTAKENSLFGKLKRAIVGIPVFKGHGDLNDADPKAIANETKKIKLGVVDQVRKTERGIEAHFALDNDGMKAVTEEGYKYPSAFWWALTNGKRGDAILAKPFKLISVALTPYPNISGVESLANARSRSAATQISEQEKNTKIPDMKLIAGWLRARGIALANSEAPTESQVLDSLESLFTSKAGEVTALGNEKSNLTGQINTLTTDRDAFKKRAEDSATALGNEQTARKADRKAAAGVIVDVAIKHGIKTVAERDAAIEALANSADFNKSADDLLKQEPSRTTTTNGRDMSGKQSAALANEAANTLAEYNAKFQEQLPLCNQDPVKADAAVKAKYPALAEKLRPKKA